MEDELSEITRILRGGDHVFIGNSASTGRGVRREMPDLPSLDALTDRMDELASEIHELVTTHDAMELLHAVDTSNRLRLRPRDTLDHGPAQAQWDAKLEYLHGLALSTTLGSVQFDTPEIQRVTSLTDQLFETNMLAILARNVERQSSVAGPSAASYVLQIESLMDRMQGYTQHLERIYDTVFAPIRDDCRSAFGFVPSDVTKVVLSMVELSNTQLVEGQELMFEMMAMETPPPREEVDPDVLHRLEVGHRRLFEPPVWTVEEVSTVSGIDRGEVEAMLTSMSATWSSQPDFLLPDDPNIARTRFVVPLDDERFWVPRPWDLIHGLLAWWAEAVDEHGDARLKERFLRSRDRSTESLTTDVLGSIFGDDLVHASQHFDGPKGHGEVDSLVSVASTPIVAECKAASLTPPGRRGAPLRVESVGDSIIGEAFEQLANVRGYVRNGGRTFSPKEGAPEVELLQASTQDVLPILVTFERMDPVATEAPAFARDPSDSAVWVVSLADLLMVGELLSHPAEFFSYAWTRAQLTPTAVATYMESDTLGLFLDDRLAELLNAADDDDVDRVLIGYSSSAINTYFASDILGTDTDTPGTGTPTPVLNALSETLSADHWTAVAHSCITVQPARWKPWRKRVRRQVRRSLPRQEFEFPECDLRVVSGPDGACCRIDGTWRELWIDVANVTVTDLL